jgi:hypothetical protein
MASGATDYISGVLVDIDHRRPIADKVWKLTTLPASPISTERYTSLSDT